MRTTLDGQVLFDEQQLEIECYSECRERVERSVGGLDGVIGIDLGSRARVIKQRGLLRAKSSGEMNERISAISAYMDGRSYTLVTSEGEEFAELRMDSFKVGKERTSGSGIVVDYEIIYMQLRV